MPFSIWKWISISLAACTMAVVRLKLLTVMVPRVVA